jgi:hypothetical protein
MSNDFLGDRVAYSWIQTQSGVPQDQKRTQVMVCTGKLKSDQKLDLKEPVIAYLPPSPGYTFDCQVLIDPSNPDHLVVGNTTVFTSNTIIQASIVITILHSYDFGKTWTVQPGPIVGPSPRIGLAREEQNLLFDDFGNLFLSFFMFSFTPDLNVFDTHEWQLFNSTDGGVTWNNLFRIKSANTQGFPDFPVIGFGSDGKEGKALWYAWTNLQEPFAGPQFTDIWAGFLPVFGLGSFGQHVERKLSNIPTNTASNLQIAVGNQGQVFLSAQQYNPLDVSSPGFDSRMLFYLNPTGTVNFSAASFLPQQDIFVTNIGQGLATDPTPVSWQPSRGFFPDALNFFAYDKKKGRLYAVGIDRRPNFNIADYVSIFYLYTDNDGASWSDMHQVNDVNFGSRGLASVAIEPKSGLLSIGFFDTRRHGPTNTTVDYWGTLFNPKKLRKKQ